MHGPGSDEPIVTYEGTTLTDRRFLMRDERGSIVSIANGSGSVTAINAYDGAAGVAEQHYGIGSTTVGSTTSAGTTGRFGYSGASGGVSGGPSASDTQMWLAELGLYHYRARIYSPTLGRFLQTDPIGYGDGMNLYAYVGNDPVNYVDPLGLFAGFGGNRDPFFDNDDIVVTGPRSRPRNFCDDPRNRNVPECNDPIRVEEIIIDDSCDRIRDILSSPTARRAIVDVINRSTTPNEVIGRAEYGTWIGRDWRGNVFSTPLFTSHRQSRIYPGSRESIHSRGNILTNAWSLRNTSSILVHGHPNNRPPSGISGPDVGWARHTGNVIVAADSAGNVTCAFPR